MAADANDVKYRIGDLYDMMDTSTRDSAITSFLADAQAYVDVYTGSEVGTLIDAAVADLAALWIVIRMTGGSAAGETFSLGNDTRLGNRDLRLMAALLQSSYERNMWRMGSNPYFEVEAYD